VGGKKRINELYDHSENKSTSQVRSTAHLERRRFPTRIIGWFCESSPPQVVEKQWRTVKKENAMIDSAVKNDKIINMNKPTISLMLMRGAAAGMTVRGGNSFSGRQQH